MSGRADFAFEELFQDASVDPPQKTELEEERLEEGDEEELDHLGECRGLRIAGKEKCFDDFSILALVGEGAYGRVYQVQCKETGSVYAMKVLKKHHLLKRNAISYTMTERDILQKVRHPFIVRMFYAFQTVERVGIVMQYVNGGQLFFHLRQEAMLSENVARFYCAQLILALEQLHSLHIIHRDLKPENILISSTGNIILTDFGLAKERVESDEGASTFCGTFEYMAPEMLKGQKYGKSADFWSVGILLYDMLNGNPPFRNKNKKRLQDDICTKKISMPTYWSKDTHSIIRGLTNKDPKQRLKLAEIKTHPFFKSINWPQLLERKIRPPFVPAIPNGELDVSNFDSEYTKKQINMENWSTGPHLSKSQDDLFEGFSFSRSFTPPPSMPVNGVLNVSSIQSELSAEISRLAKTAADVGSYSYDDLEPAGILRDPKKVVCV